MQRAAMSTITLEHLVEAMSAMTNNVNKLVEAQTTSNRGRKKWEDTSKFKNIKLFCGDQKEWEEFQVKFKSQVGAGYTKGKDMMEEIETMMEATVENQDWSQVGDVDVTEKMAEAFSGNLRNVLLLNLTTKEANAVVRRCRGNGLWAWRRLSSSLTPGRSRRVSRGSPAC